VYRVERNYRNNQRAAELEAVIKSIGEAKVALEHQNWDIAVKLLEKASELDPNSKNVHYQLAQIYQKLNQPDKAREHLQIFQKLYAEEREKKVERLDDKQKEMARPSN